ncbi:conjugative transposon protein TraK [Rhizosphaericola mali]|uniref:Conjugative transposon protein TraK n=1 Tax=Rhizosphaericola mali TaxID=2545455 RepID=A0A5P2FZZ2_9BACT|nr:conjugative transposon protein TraK [Rhizosphaericola mali]QES88547.1 conjugative transposon protein TraK [Rhizosphaericola mali]
MFRQLKNIESAFRHVKLFTFVVVCCAAIVSCYAIYTSFQQVQGLQGKVYVISNGKLLEATAMDRKFNIQVELKDHVRMFHYYFFTLDPDEKANAMEVTKALYLADNSAKQQYDNLKESGFYSNVVAGNVTQRIQDDSITLDINQLPYYFRYYGKQTITRPTSKVVRRIVTEGYLREVSQSDNNPHGFLVERWQTLDNSDIFITKR